MSIYIYQNAPNYNFKYVKFGAYQLCLNTAEKSQAIDLGKISATQICKKNYIYTRICIYVLNN